MHIFQKCYTAFCVLLLVTNISLGQTKQALAIDSCLQQANKSGLFNGNALIIDHGKIIYKAAIGYADASRQIPLTVKHRFFIGSIAKEFDAVAIMMLQEQNKLTIDDKVDKYFPDLPVWASTISIKNLLQYASGLPDINWKTVHSDADN